MAWVPRICFNQRPLSRIVLCHEQAILGVFSSTSITSLLMSAELSLQPIAPNKQGGNFCFWAVFPPNICFAQAIEERERIKMTPTFASFPSVAKSRESRIFIIRVCCTHTEGHMHDDGIQLPYIIQGASITSHTQQLLHILRSRHS